MGITKERAKFLRQFDQYVRNCIEDEDAQDYWLREGIPDGAYDDELLDIAGDDEEWLDIVLAFAKTCRLARVI